MTAADWLDGKGLSPGVIVVGLGGNIGGDELVGRRLREALATLSRIFGPARVSDFYRSAPVGPVAEQNDFINAVAAFRPEPVIEPEAALFALQRLELAEGRVRARAGGPRTLDLDLLLVGQETRSHEALVLPHPRMHDRAFVLAPLCDLFGVDFSWHGIDSLGVLLDRAADQRIERIEL